MSFKNYINLLNIAKSKSVDENKVNFIGVKTRSQ